jgi:gliding motility-associated lipoprotein GldH
MHRISFIAALILIGTGLLSCNPNVIIDDYHKFDDYAWLIKDEQKFTFKIEDNALKYSILYNIRHALQYPYYNLYVTYELKDASGKVLSTRLQELALYDAKTGEPLGDGLGDIYDRQLVCLSGVSFPAKGEYTFTIKQYMRQDPLPGIMSVGIKVEKETK